MAFTVLLIIIYLLSRLQIFIFYGTHFLNSWFAWYFNSESINENNILAYIVIGFCGFKQPPFAKKKVFLSLMPNLTTGLLLIRNILLGQLCGVNITKESHFHFRIERKPFCVVLFFPTSFVSGIIHFCCFIMQLCC